MAIFALSVDGGWSTEDGPTAPFVAKGTGAVGETLISVPWLVAAENVVYNLDGWPQKMPGAARVNGTATGASDHVTGVFDFWRLRVGGNAEQERILYSGAALYSEGGGILTAIKTGLEAEAMPCFETMNDELVIASSSTTDVPQAYDMTTCADLGGSPPNFAFHVQHRGRLWAAGVATAKARLYYSASANHEDWTGAGSGSIDLPGQITALRSFKNELVIFLGPHDPAIFRLTGSSPTGSDAFALHPFVHGVGATNHQAIVLGPGGDLWFWDDAGIHSLAATAAYGDYAPQFLSAQIARYFVDQLNHARFTHVWGVNFSGAGYALWTVSRSGAATHDAILMLDYRFPRFRFALWPAYAAASLAMVRDGARLSIPWCGTYTGRALRMNRPARGLDGVAFAGCARLPFLPFGDPFQEKLVGKGRVGLVPKGETNVTVSWQRDAATLQSTTVSQGGRPTLAPSSDQFVLDEDTLGGGNRYASRFFDMAGSFKEVQLTLEQDGLDVDMEIHSLALELDGVGMGTREIDG